MDAKKVFMLRRGELRERFDPYFYEPEFRQIEENLQAGKYKVVKLRDVSRFQAGFAFKSQDYTDVSNTFLLSIKHITEDGTVVFEDPTFLPDKFYTEFADFQVHHNDIVIAMTGATIGKVGLFDGSVNTLLNQRNGIIRSNSNSCNRMYLFYFLSTETFRAFVRRNSNGSAQPNISETDITKIVIPLPPLETQEKVVEIMQAAHAAKRTKEAEARTLLESIDGYVLSELGITLPEERREMVFRVPFSRVQGGRLDPSYYQSMITLHSTRFPSVRLNTVAEINPKVSFSYLPPDTLLSFVPMEAVDERFAEITLMQTRPAAGFKGYTRFEEQDLLWAKITPCMENGKSAIAQNLSNGAGFGSTEFHVVRAGENVNIHYIHNLLRLKKIRETATLDFTGSSGHQRVSEKFLQQFIIPLPPLAVQERIAAEAQARRERAKALEREAAELLQTAKREVERMILGESA